MILRDEDLRIQPAGEENIGDLLMVYKECEDFLALGPVATASREMVLSDLKTSQSEGGKFCGIYLQDGPIVGVLDFVPKNFRGQSGTAYIALLMLRKSFRGRGIGSRVVERIESEVRKDPGAACIRAGVMVNNPPAIRFWQARGFEIVSGPERLADQTTVFRLEKKILHAG